MDAAPAASPPAILTAVDLRAAAARAGAWQPKDAFDAPPDTSELSGKAFRVALPVRPDSEASGSEGPSWSFDPVQQQLSLSSRPQTWSYVWKTKAPYYFGQGYTLSSTRKLVGSHVGSNAFGVRAKVRSYVWYGLALGSFEPGSFDYRAALAVSLQMNSDHARSLVPHLEMIIEGVVGKINDRSAVVCGTSFSSATIDDPTEETEEICVVAVDIRKIRFVDARDGSTLASTSPPPSAQAPASSNTNNPVNALNRAQDSTDRIQALINSVVSDQEWLHRPSPEDIQRYFPTRALNLRTSGRASMRCVITSTGSLTQCDAVEETPIDMGFGDAALKLARFYRARLHIDNGTASEGQQVTVPISFDLQ